MQIFLTDPNYQQCAKDLDDRRLNKIIIESAQIASTALWIDNCGAAESMYPKGQIYLPSHEHSSLCKWASSGWRNICNCVSYGFALCFEYRYRFKTTHKTEKILDSILIKSSHFFKDEGSEDHINCTTHHKHVDDIYEAYRMELCLKWNKLDKKEPKWTNRTEPKFRKEFYYENIS